MGLKRVRLMSLGHPDYARGSIRASMLAEGLQPVDEPPEEYDACEVARSEQHDCAAYATLVSIDDNKETNMTSKTENETDGDTVQNADEFVGHALGTVRTTITIGDKPKRPRLTPADRLKREREKKRAELAKLDLETNHLNNEINKLTAAIEELERE